MKIYRLGEARFHWDHLNLKYKWIHNFDRGGTCYATEQELLEMGAVEDGPEIQELELTHFPAQVVDGVSIGEMDILTDESVLVKMNELTRASNTHEKILKEICEKLSI